MKLIDETTLVQMGMLVTRYIDGVPTRVFPNAAHPSDAAEEEHLMDDIPTDAASPSTRTEPAPRDTSRYGRRRSSLHDVQASLDEFRASTNTRLGAM